MVEHISIKDFLDRVTVCLKNDLEVQLDVRAELRTHLEEQIAKFQNEGHTELEAIDLALGTFGSAGEVAESLLMANARRMKLRALARLSIRAVLIPAALILVVWVCASMANRSFPRVGWVNVQSELFEPLLDDLGEEQRFLFVGDTSRKRFSQQQRAIWEAHPDRIEYLDNYLTFLVEDQMNSKAFPPDYLITEFEHAKALDPENARYNYLLAGLLIKSSTSIKNVDEDEIPPEEIAAAGSSCSYGWTCGGRTRYQFEIRDRNLLNRAMTEILEGAKKPYFRSYAGAMAHERIAQLPRATKVEEQAARVRMATGRFLPENAIGDEIVKAVARCAALAQQEGDTELSERLLQSWYPYATKMAEDGETGLDLLVIQYSMSQAEFDFAPIFVSMNREAQAEAVRKLARSARAPYLGRSAQVPVNEDEGGLRDPRVQQGGLLSGTFVAPMYYPPGTSLRQIVSVNQNVLERIGLLGIALTLSAALIGSILIALRWIWARTDTGQPVLILLRPLAFARVVAYSILIPLFVYVVYTRWTTFSGREYSVLFMGGRFALELALLGFAMVCMSMLQTSHYVRARCEAIDIPTPAAISRKTLGFGGLLAVLAASSCVAMNYWTGERANMTVMVGQYGVFIGFLVAFAVVVAQRFARCLTGARSFGQYYGTVARSLIPVLATGLVILCGLVNPYLANAETRLIHNTPHIVFDADHPGITELEVAGVAPLKLATYEALAGEESETLVETLMQPEIERER